MDRGMSTTQSHSSTFPYIPWRSTVTESLLVHAGFHPLGEWWAPVLDRVRYERPRVWVVRKGRRAGGTVSAIRWLIEQALERHWNVDRGDVGVIPIVSARRWQAEDRV